MLASLSGREARDRMVAGELSVGEYARALLARVDEVDADVQAWIAKTTVALKLVPDFVPAALIAARIQSNRGEARTPGNEVLHSPRLTLIDRGGHVRGWFDGRKVDDEGHPINEIPKLKQAVAVLLGDSPSMGPEQLKVWLPASNAVLNSTCAVLLVLGYLCIRGRKVMAHKACVSKEGDRIRSCFRQTDTADTGIPGGAMSPGAAGGAPSGRN